MQRYENIDKKLQKELQKMDGKFESESEMSNQDLELIDCLFHALKSAETYYAMAEGGEMSYGMGSGNYGSGNSYARGRDSRGRYTSREMSREGYSGHYPPPPYSYYSGGYDERW